MTALMAGCNWSRQALRQSTWQYPAHMSRLEGITVVATHAPDRVRLGYCEKLLRRPETWAKAGACVANIGILQNLVVLSAIASPCSNITLAMERLGPGDPSVLRQGAFDLEQRALFRHHHRYPACQNLAMLTNAELAQAPFCSC